MKKIVLSILFLVLIVAAVLCIASFATLGWLLARNTLDNDGRWISTKERLELFANGASSFMREPQGLARCRLNLGAWNGYQEIVAKSKIEGRRIEFDFLLEPNAYFTFFLCHDLRQFSGIRFSVNPDFPCAYLAGKANGEFTGKQVIDMGDLLAQQPHHVLIELDNHETRLTVDGQPVNTEKVPAPDLCRIGFRGGARPVYIDNVMIDGVMFDDFFEMERWPTLFGIALIGVLFANMCVLAMLKMVDLAWNRAPVALLSLNWMAAFFAIALAVFAYYFAERYPNGLALQRAENEFLRCNGSARDKEIEADAARATSDKSMILFIGSSQTWGAGATRKEDTFVNQVQQRLDADAPNGSRYVCVNAGVAGTGSRYLLDQYEKKWMCLNPKMLVINLSCNDGFNPEFAADLERFIALNKEHNIQTVFVLEANSIETASDELPLHPVMRKVGQDNHVPVVESHNYLKENHDKGFLWWDNVHATSFGQSLIADCVFNALRTLLPN